MLALGNFFFKRRNALFPLALVLLLLPSPRLFADWRIAAVVGTGMVLFGQLLRAATVGLVYIIRGGRNREVYAADLVTEGMFAHCRNPLYVGNYVGILGALVVSNSVVAVAVGSVFFLIAYLSIVRAEEHFLAGKFADEYTEYCRRVPRFGLKLEGLGETFAASRFNWQRLVVKEYGTMIISLAGVPAILLFTRHYPHDWVSLQDPLDRGLIIVIGILLLAWGVARWLKKSGRITA